MNLLRGVWGKEDEGRRSGRGLVSLSARARIKRVWSRWSVVVKKEVLGRWRGDREWRLHSCVREAGFGSGSARALERERERRRPGAAGGGDTGLPLHGFVRSALRHKMVSFVQEKGGIDCLRPSFLRHAPRRATCFVLFCVSDLRWGGRAPRAATAEHGGCPFFGVHLPTCHRGKARRNVTLGTRPVTSSRSSSERQGAPCPGPCRMSASVGAAPPPANCRSLARPPAKASPAKKKEKNSGVAASECWAVLRL